MRKILQNKVYDTDTASKIMSVTLEAERSRDKKDIVTESLYRKRTGEFFLVREDMYGTKVLPQTYNDAKAWGINNQMPQETIKSAFWESDSSPKKEALLISIPASMISRLRMEASSRNMSVSGLLEEIIQNTFKEKNRFNK